VQALWQAVGWAEEDGHRFSKGLIEADHELTVILEVPDEILITARLQQYGE